VVKAGQGVLPITHLTLMKQLFFVALVDAMAIAALMGDAAEVGAVVQARGRVRQLTLM